MNQINASIVLYHNNTEQLTKVIKSFLNTELRVKLYLVDNSSNDDLKELENIDERVEYIFNNANLGYGSAHNIAMKRSIEDADLIYRILANKAKGIYSPKIELWHPEPNYQSISLEKVKNYASGFGYFVRKNIDNIKVLLLILLVGKKIMQFIMNILNKRFQKCYFKAFFSGLFTGLMYK